MKSLQIRLRCHRLAHLLAGLAMMILPGKEILAGGSTIECTVPQATFTLPFPASISVPAGIPVNTALTPWVKVVSANFFACRALLPGWSVALGYRPLSLADTGHRYNFNGVAYTVFRTTVPGIGLVVQVVANPHGSPGVRRDLGTPGGAPPPWVGAGWANSDGWFHQPIPLGGEVSATLVKTGPISDGREIMPSTVAEAAWWESGVLQNDRVTFQIPRIGVRVTSCQTPDLSVQLGSHKASAFSGRGSTTPAVNFNVAIKNCPAGMSQVKYEISAPDGIVDASNGVMALAASSTAKGVGIRLTDSNDRALKFNSQYTLSSYKAATGGTYSVPLRASYYQTGSGAVTSGTANGSLVFILSYL